MDGAVPGVRVPWGQEGVCESPPPALHGASPTQRTLERRPPPVLPVGARHTGPPSAARRAFRIAHSPLGGGIGGSRRLSRREGDAPLSGARHAGWSTPRLCLVGGGGVGGWCCPRGARAVRAEESVSFARLRRAMPARSGVSVTLRFEFSTQGGRRGNFCGRFSSEEMCADPSSGDARCTGSGWTSAHRE